MGEKPEKCLGYWINKVERTMKNIHDKKLQQYDLTSSQVMVLHQLWHKEGLTQKEIHENLSLKGASVSGLVDTLLSKGLVERRQDNEDARFKRLYLTDCGRKLESESMNVIMEVEDLLARGFSEDEKVIFGSWLRKLYMNLNDAEK